MNKFEVRTQQKKDAIVQAALKLFKEKGFVHVSIKDIAEESGVSSVSLYNYFGSKEGVVKECANVLMQNTIRMATELLNQDIEFKDKLSRVLASAPTKTINCFVHRVPLKIRCWRAYIAKAPIKLEWSLFRNLLSWGRRKERFILRFRWRPYWNY